MVKRLTLLGDCVAKTIIASITVIGEIGIGNHIMNTIKNTINSIRIDGLIFTVNNLIVRFPNWDFDKLYFYRCGNI